MNTTEPSARARESAAAEAHPRESAATERLLTRSLVQLTAADLAYFTAAGVAIYTLPMFVTGPVGSGRAGAGLAFGAFAVTALVLRPFAGRLTDRHGRRPLLLGGAALAAATMLLTGLVEDLALVILLRLLLGVAEAAFMVASFAAVADLAPPSRMGQVLSYNSLGLYLGLAAGPPLGELLTRSLGFPAAWTGAAALAGLAVLLVAGLPETRSSEPGAASGAGRTGPAHQPVVHRPSIPPALGFLASTIAMSAFLAFAALHADAVGLAGASLPLTVYGGVVVLGRISFARFMDVLPPHLVAATALVTMALGLAAAALWQSAAGLLVGAAVLALGVVFSTPAFFSAIFATAGPAERGAAAGTASAAIDLGLGAGPIALGLVAEGLGLPWVFGAGAAAALVGTVWTVSVAARADR
ncbi:MFS transporter [Ornithinimicrobium sp. F0845]|uniref:MFS transporter n=1 Tax=Ornithinimicrobium sp. F0845 TaxID=2926412 RepID=UPI001FF5AF86|nr:MFS transporter [Ornithinimicrobium sp. F0845]MCK0110585.1 MFS transporter [Ornithinimicrobium sp. F0845]